MTRFSALVFVASLLVWANAAQAQEAVTIKMKTRGAGDVVLVTKKDDVITKLKVEDGKGNVVVDKNETKTEIYEYKETVHERDGSKPPTKVEREYTRGEIKAGGETEDLELKGKSVIITRKGDKYSYAFKEGKEVAGKAAETLAKEFSRKSETSNAEIEKLMLPKNAVKPGDTWKLDVQPILDNLFKTDEVGFFANKATGSGKLLKAYKKDGKQFGEIRYDLTVPLKTMGKVPTQMNFNDGAKMTLQMTLDTCIDGSTEDGTVNVRVNLVGTASSGDAVVRIDVLSLVNASQVEPKKK